MTTTFDLTANEFKAAMVLVKSCLDGMGGKRPADLEYDEYTWVDAKVLMDAGWNKNEAAGTFGALMEKGLVEEYDRNEWCLTTQAWKYLDTVWDAAHEATGSEGQLIDPVTGADIEPEPKETEMTVALIDIANLKVEFHADPEKAQTKADKQDLLYVGKPEDLGDLTGPQMVALYNATASELNTGLDPVNRFANKEAGIRRLMANITDLWETRRTMEKAKAKPAKTIKAESIPGGEPNRFKLNAAGQEAVKAARRGTGINLAPMKKAYACREGSKQATLVDMLSRKQGATMDELLEALSGGAKPWKEVTVKSGLNWDMNKIKGYGIRTTKRGDADCYHLVLPAGLDAPLPHTPRKKGA